MYLHKVSADQSRLTTFGPKIHVSHRTNAQVLKTNISPKISTCTAPIPACDTDPDCSQHACHVHVAYMLLACPHTNKDHKRRKKRRFRGPPAPPPCMTCMSLAWPVRQHACSHCAKLQSRITSGCRDNRAPVLLPLSFSIVAPCGQARFQ